MKGLILMSILTLINVVRKNVKCLAILLLVAGFFSCNKQSSVEDPDEEFWGKGVGQIEFLGKNYLLDGAYSYKWTSFSPPPLGVAFFEDVENGNYLAIPFSKTLYDTWPSLELPEGIYENFHVEFTLSDGTKGYYCDNQETKMVVNKTDDEYDITITGKVLLILEIDQDWGMETSLETFRMTWKGEIKVSYDEPFCPR